MMKLMLFSMTILSLSSWGQTLGGKDLKEISNELNKSLPEIYDHATKLQKTTVENSNLFYHFVLSTTEKDYAFALPKVKQQVLSTICRKPREAFILKRLRANIIYRYESLKGFSLGEFMVRPEHCQE